MKNKSNKNKSIQNFFLNNIAKFCDKCGTIYKDSDIKILESFNSNYIIQANCSKCKTSHLATVLKNSGISSKINIKTDLTEQELKTKLPFGPIKSDEVLEMHNTLKLNDSVAVFVK